MWVFKNPYRQMLDAYPAFLFSHTCPILPCKTTLQPSSSSTTLSSVSSDGKPLVREEGVIERPNQQPSSKEIESCNPIQT